MSDPVGSNDFRWPFAAIDAYKPIKDPDRWHVCPLCKVHPRIWVFDNGRRAKCCCGRNVYLPSQVSAQSIMACMRFNGGSLRFYDNDALRKNWNFYAMQILEL